MVLTEYVVGDEHGGFSSALGRFGFAYLSISTAVPRQNQTLVATREPHTLLEVDVPPIHPSLAPNVLEVALDDSGVTVPGFRMPTYSGPDARLKRPTWEWLHEHAAAIASKPAILTGDLNTAMGASRARCGDCLKSFRSIGWAIDTPSSGES